MHFCVISMLKSLSRNPGLDKVQMNASIGPIRLGCQVIIWMLHS